MSRSGYSTDIDGWALICWRGRVTSAIRGKRGQKLLKDLAEAMDAMADKKLIKYELKANGQYCALGVVGEKRGICLDDIDPEDADTIGEQFDIAVPLAQEIVFQNDEAVFFDETPEERWKRMRKWVDEQIKYASTPDKQKGEK